MANGNIFGKIPSKTLWTVVPSPIPNFKLSLNAKEIYEGIKPPTTITPKIPAAFVIYFVPSEIVETALTPNLYPKDPNQIRDIAATIQIP